MHLKNNISDRQKRHHRGLLTENIKELMYQHYRHLDFDRPWPP